MRPTKLGRIVALRALVLIGGTRSPGFGLTIGSLDRVSPAAMPPRSRVDMAQVRRCRLTEQCSVLAVLVSLARCRYSNLLTFPH